MSRDGTYGYTIVSAPHGDDNSLRTYARFECGKCRKTYSHRIIGGRPLNSEGYAKDARAKGWVADAWRKSGTRCPDCAKAKAVNDPNSELKKVVPMSTTPPPASVSVQPIREPTGDQRLRIRSLLDKHFDDGAGMFLDDMSDLRIAETVGVPRVVVERIREAAYGPIKVSPEMSKLRADIEDIKTRLTKMTAEVTGLSSRIEKALAGKAA